MLQKLYPYRFQIFLFTQLSILFGSLLFVNAMYEHIISPLFNIGNILAGLVLLQRKKKTMWLVGTILLLATLSFSLTNVEKESLQFLNFIRLISFFSFHVLVTIELIIQVWNTKTVNENTVLGLISGFIALGFVGFFMCLSVEFFQPDSFHITENGVSQIQNLLYYSYITLLTIGYGEIVPTTNLAQKVAILIGLSGQLYMVILTGIILGKYIEKRAHA